MILLERKFFVSLDQVNLTTQGFMLICFDDWFERKTKAIVAISHREGGFTPCL